MKRNFFAVIFALLCIFVWCVPAVSAEDYFVKGKNAEMIKAYKRAAEDGDVEAQRDLGNIYYFGIGVDADLNEARKWLTKAAEKGDVKSQSLLASLYLREQNFNKGVEWMRKAAGNGDGISLFVLGRMYLTGTEVPQDYNEALKYLNKAADQEFYPALIKLSEMYSYGVGVEKDEKKAAELLDRAKKVEGNYTESQKALAKGDVTGAFKGWIKEAEAGDIGADTALKVLKEYGHWDGKSKDKEFSVGDKDLKKMATAFNYVSEKKYEEALKLYEKEAVHGDTIAKEFVQWLKWKSTTLDEVLEAADNGDAGAQFDVGMRSWEQEDSKEAVKWFLKSMKQGFLLARVMLASMTDGKVNLDKLAKISGYESKAASKKDPYGNPLDRVSYQEKKVEALKGEDKKKLHEAAERGDAKSQLLLGDIYFYAENNEKEALKWYRKAAEQGDVKSQSTLGQMYSYVNNMKEAFKWNLKAAEQGDVVAQVNLAASYFEGWGVEIDYKEAFKWYVKAAEQGDAIAEDRVGTMYALGTVGEPNLEEAKKWLEKAAAKGFAHSQYLLGRMYFRGDGVKRDAEKGGQLIQEALKKGEIEASKYFLESINFAADTKLRFELSMLMAEAGFPEAQYFVGYMYYKGDGVTKNFDEAMKWFYAAANGGHEQSVKIISEFVASEEDGDIKTLNELVTNPFNMFSEEELRQKFEKFKKDALAGNVKAQAALGTSYALGKGTEKDLNEAKKWYKKAAENGDEMAYYLLNTLEKQQKEQAESNAEKPRKAPEKKNKKTKNIWIALTALIGLIFLVKSSKIKAKMRYNLGGKYEKGDSQPQNFEKAFACYKEAAELGMLQAQSKLGSMYYYGKGCQPNFEEALKWCMKAAERGDAVAQRITGSIYFEGKGTEQNVEEAFKWYEKAAKNNDAEAQKIFGLMCYRLDNIEEAFFWFLKAAEQGLPEAQYVVGNMYYTGNGVVERDLKEAFNWFYSAGEHGEADAQYSLGIMYYNGEFVEKNYDDAFKWFLKSAKQDNAAAQFEIGYMFENGISVEQNYSAALMWYKKADANGDERAAEKIKEFKVTRNADIYTADFSSDDEEAPDKKVEAYHEDEAEQKEETTSENTNNEEGGGNESADEKEQVKTETEKRKFNVGKFVVAIGLVALIAVSIFSIYDDSEDEEESSEKVVDAEELFVLGLRYYSGNGVRQNYEKAMEYFHKAAELGYAPAQASLGEMYREGRGVNRDYKESFKWYLKAAESGMSESQYNVGYMYYHGEGVEVSKEKAADWFMKAAEQGYAPAQNYLGKMFFLGEGLPVNEGEGIRLYKRAAARGNENAKKTLKMIAEKALEAAKGGDAGLQFVVGGMYMFGDGFEQNYEEAVKWFEKAAAQGLVDAKFFLGSMYECGEGVEKNYETAFKWFKEAADLGDKEAIKILNDWDHVREKRFAGCSLERIMKFAKQGEAEAMFAVGRKYFYGDYYADIEVNYKEALNWFLKAADKGCAEAANYIGNMYLGGQGVDKNYENALLWWQKAEKSGFRKAAHNIGAAYFYGLGVEQDYNEAFKWFKEGAESGEVKSNTLLGVMYFAGKSVNQNFVEAEKLLLKAGEEGDLTAQKMLGAIYYYGECGVAKNRKEAMKWYKKAAEQGDGEAKEILKSNGKGNFKTMKDMVNEIFDVSQFDENEDHAAVIGVYTRAALKLLLDENEDHVSGQDSAEFGKLSKNDEEACAEARAIMQKDSPLIWRNYLKNFPDGQCAEEAKTALKTLNAVKKVLEERVLNSDMDSEPLEEFWNAVQAEIEKEKNK